MNNILDGRLQHYSLFNPIALSMAKTPQSFGHSECNRIITDFSYWRLCPSGTKELIHFSGPGGQGTQVNNNDNLVVQNMIFHFFSFLHVGPQLVLN